MRRRLQTLVPIVLFAVLVQLLAPVGAFRAVAGSSGDSLGMASICSSMASASDRQHAPSNAPAGQCCAFCACAHGVAAVWHNAPPAVTSLPPEYDLVAWFERTGALATAHSGSNAQARAPPALS